jgi:hypothetical protein
MADQLELGLISPRQFIDQLLGHTDALERLRFDQLKEAHLVREQLRRVVEGEQAATVDVHAVADWLRRWISNVPCGPP